MPIGMPPTMQPWCVGDFDTEHVKARIEEWFGPLKPSEATAHAEAPDIREPVVTSHTIYDQVPLPALVLTWHTPSLYSPGDAELDVLSDVLAGGADARLTADLIHERRLVQELDVFQYSRKRGSLFMVVAILSPGADIDEVEQAIHAAIGGIASGEAPITERELAQTKNGLEMSFLWGLETPLEKAEMLQSYLFYLGTTEYLAQDRARYNAVSGDSVLAVAAERLTPELASRMVVLSEEETAKKPILMLGRAPNDLVDDGVGMCPQTTGGAGRWNPGISHSSRGCRPGVHAQTACRVCIEQWGSVVASARHGAPCGVHTRDFARWRFSDGVVGEWRILRRRC